jgi:hypothetical protein
MATLTRSGYNPAKAEKTGEANLGPPAPVWRTLAEILRRMKTKRKSRAQKKK